MEETQITSLVALYGLSCILAGFWAGTQNWFALTASGCLIGYCFYRLIFKLV